jgi:hypothetical protein
MEWQRALAAALLLGDVKSLVWCMRRTCTSLISDAVLPASITSSLRTSCRSMEAILYSDESTLTVPLTGESMAQTVLSRLPSTAKLGSLSLAFEMTFYSRAPRPRRCE